MCKLCETQPVYEFTNQRKLCKRCFINYFHKKFLYTIRKFNLINLQDIIYYKKGNQVNEVVLEKMLYFFSEKSNFKLVAYKKIPLNVKNKKVKIALSSCIDDEADKIFENFILKNSGDLKKFLPSYKNTIKPLYFFLEQEVLLYANLNSLSFKTTPKKENKFSTFINELEKLHPEVKRAMVNSLLKLN